MAEPWGGSLAELAAALIGTEPGVLSVAQAQACIARIVPQAAGIEMVALRSALGRVLAHDIVSLVDVPAHDNSAMDGYALRTHDLRGDTTTELRCVGHALAGQAYAQQVPAGACVRVTTGALMPAGLDAVVPQELVTLDGALVRVPSGAIEPGQHRRRAGEDLARGDVALGAGRCLRPVDLGLLASLGRAEVAVRRRLRVAFFSTGSELRSIGQPLGPSGVYDSNRYTLWGMLERLGVTSIDLGVVPDDPAALETAFTRAAQQADAVITSGGVSVGEADHTKAVMSRLGDVLFWRIAMRPGRPMAIGRLRGQNPPTVLFGLPGNPVAVMVTFYALVRPALLAMSGAQAQPQPTLQAIAVQPFRKLPGRTEYQRGILSRDAQGRWQVQPTGDQGSGILRSMSQAHGLVVLGHDQGDVAVGDPVEVMPFDGLA